MQQPHATTSSTHNRPTTPNPKDFTLVLITTPEVASPGSRQFDAEVRAARALFADGGLTRLHLRKPHSPPEHVAAYLSALPPEHRGRVVVHGAAVAGCALAAAVAPFVRAGELGGVHYRELDRAESARKGHAFWDDGAQQGRALLRSSGYHSLAAAVGGAVVAEAVAAAAAAGADEAAAAAAAEEEAATADREPWPPGAYLDYCFLSPVYDSISKAGYRAAGFLAPGEGRRRRLAAALGRSPVPVLALGGVGPGKLAELRDAGFAGAAVLGAVWRAGGGGDVVAAYRGLAEEAREAAGRRGGAAAKGGGGGRS